MESGDEPKVISVRPLSADALGVLARRAQALDDQADSMRSEAEQLFDRAEQANGEAGRMARTAAELQALYVELSRTTASTDTGSQPGPAGDDGPLLCEKLPGSCLLARDHEGSCAVQDTGWEWEL